MLLETDVYKMLVDGTPWGAWKGFQLPVSDEFACIWTPTGTRKHWKPDFWEPDFFLAKHHSLSYFWPGSWYTIHINYHPDGSFAYGYCDIILPTPHYTNTSRKLIYTDLYIDVVIREDHSVFTKDHEVYDRAAKRFPIVEESRAQAYKWLDFVEQHAKTWTGPFVIMPQHLPRTDFITMDEAEIRHTLD